MAIIPSKELVAQIKSRIEAILSELSPSQLDLQKVAAELHALPLYFDSGGGLVLKPTGELLEFSWDNPRDAQEVDDPRLINIALYQGSRDYPELEALVPLRPSNATVCPYCKGTGYPISALDLNIEGVVCYCGGVGWVP